MQNWSYEQQIGLLTNTTYGKQKIPTLLGNDGTSAGNYYNDHPAGRKCHHPEPVVAMGWSGQTTATPSRRARSTTSLSPTMAGRRWRRENGRTPGASTAAGMPFVVCTTCHNQHDMTVYASTKIKPDPEGRRRKILCHLFLRQRSLQSEHSATPSTPAAPSTAQFCRECHFNESNESHNTPNIATVFQ